MTLLKKIIAFILVLLFSIFWFLPFHTWNIIASILLVIWFISAELFIIIHPVNQKKAIRITYFLIGTIVLVLGLILSREQLPAVALIAYAGTGLLMITRSLRNKGRDVTS